MEHLQLRQTAVSTPHKRAVDAQRRGQFMRQQLKTKPVRGDVAAQRGATIPQLFQQQSCRPGDVHHQLQACEVTSVHALPSATRTATSSSATSTANAQKLEEV